MNATRPYWWKVNIGSGNGLVPSGNKPLPEPMLTQIYVANHATRPQRVKIYMNKVVFFIPGVMTGICLWMFMNERQIYNVLK